MSRFYGRRTSLPSRAVAYESIFHACGHAAAAIATRVAKRDIPFESLEANHQRMTFASYPVASSPRSL